MALYGRTSQSQYKSHMRDRYFGTRPVYFGYLSHVTWPNCWVWGSQNIWPCMVVPPRIWSIPIWKPYERQIFWLVWGPGAVEGDRQWQHSLSLFSWMATCEFSNKSISGDGKPTIVLIFCIFFSLQALAEAPVKKHGRGHICFGTWSLQTNQSNNRKWRQLIFRMRTISLDVAKPTNFGIFYDLQ